MIRSTLLLFILFTNTYSICSQKLPSFITDSLDNYIESALKQWNAPGVGVAIVKDGKVVLAKGYGYSNLEKQTKVDQNTLFQIG